MSTGFIFLTAIIRRTPVGRCLPLVIFTFILCWSIFFLFSTPRVQAEPVQPPQEIRFQPGAISGSVTGTLAAGSTVQYTLWAREGQQMDVVLSGNAVRLLVEAPNPQTLSEQSDPKLWSGILPQSGIYMLSIANLSKSGEAYTLTVTIVTPPLIPPAQTNQTPILPQQPIRAQIPIAFQGTGQAIGNAVSNDVALGDLDGDGDLDAFVANGSPVHQQSNQIWLNDGKGFFAETGQDFGRGISNGVALGDLDGDGDLDAFVANTGVNQIWVNLWNGAGAPKFVAAVNVLTGTSPYTSTAVALGDLNGDGHLDAVVANYGEVNEVWLNTSKQLSGTQPLAFTLAVTDATWVSDKTSDVALADLNDDGCVDIVFVPDGVWLNTQDIWKECTAKFIRSREKFTRSDFDSIISAMPEAEQNHLLKGEFDNDAKTRIALGDLDGDQNIDIIIGSADAYIYRNDGDGNFTARAIQPHEQSNFLYGIALGDLDFDGKVDAFVTTMSLNRNNIMRNEGDYRFSFVDRYASNKGQAVALGDLNADGLLDAFATGGQGSQPSSSQVLLNVALPLQLTVQTSITNLINKVKNVGDKAVSTDKEIDSIQLAFLNDDAYLDAITFTPNKIWLNDGQGRLLQSNAPFPGGGEVHNIATGDLNNDHAVDLVVSKRGCLGVTASLCSEVNVFINQENHFIHAQTVTKSLYVRSDTTALGDLNGDGYLDMVVARWCGDRPNCQGSNRIYLNCGNRIPADLNCKNEIFYDAGELGGAATTDVALGDLDGDGDLDAVVANYWNQPTTIYLNDGKGTFTSNSIELGRFSSVEVAIADLDNDGAMDILESRYEMGVTIWWNQGQYHFVAEDLLWEPAERHDIEVADINGDGMLDVVVSASHEAHNVFLNAGSRTFNEFSVIDEQHRTPLPSNALGDLDNDGDIDALFAYVEGIAQYTNQRQGIANTPVDISMLDSTNLIRRVAQSGLVTTTIIPIQLSATLSVVCQDRAISACIRAEYLLDDGGQWFPARSATIRPTRSDIFYWDTFASGFFGQSNNVVLRLAVQTQPVQPAPAGTYTYPNQITGSYQAATGVATTEPFAVRGTLVRVCKELIEAELLRAASDCRSTMDTITPSSLVTPVANAIVYAWRAGSPTAQRMGDPATGLPFVTNAAGYLSGRGQLDRGDQLLAMLPVTHTYRIPPQLFFDGSSGYVQVNPTDELSGAHTVEFWLFPMNKSGTLLRIGNALTLTYATITRTTTISLAFPGQAYTATAVALNNGLAHHLAVSWQTEMRDTVRFYVDGEPTIISRQPISISGAITLGLQYAGAMDEIRLWNGARTREQISATLLITSPLYNTADADLFTVEPAARQTLLGYWPIGQEDGPLLHDQSGHGNDAMLAGGVYVGYKPLATIYHTSGAISDTVQFSKVITPGVQPLVVSSRNPLILFDLDVSLEWDARSDTRFLQQLEDSFKRASALLYDVTNGQVALGQINLFHNKGYWGVADIVIYADNSLRPSAAIGGVVNGPIDEPTAELEGRKGAYLRGQVRMGVSWDPYGENIADLGDAWARALAHELAHYLLFLPDNYLGLNDRGIMRRVVCPGSFMTTSGDPNYSEFLTKESMEWQYYCQQTLAQKTTHRADWETIQAFYPMLNAPKPEKLDGPSDLPLNVTVLIPWAFADQTPPLPERNFDIRGTDESRLRLPDAQAYLIKTQGTTTLEDDVLILLGSPTGGGDRLKVRGAANDDRLCVVDSRNQQSYSGCIDPIDSTTVAVLAGPIPLKGGVWRPAITAHAETAYSVAVTVEQTLLSTETLMVQIFPMHYGSVAGNAPAASMNCPPTPVGTTLSGYLSPKSCTQTLTMTLPAYEIAVRIWVNDDGSCARRSGSSKDHSCIREAISTFRLTPDHWDPVNGAPDSATPIPQGQLTYAPLTAGPDKPGIGGPDKSGIGSPDKSGIGGPDKPGIGGPDKSGIGGPNRIVVGGAILIGNPDKSGIGGPDKPGIGGALRMLLGNPDNIVAGGMSMIGNPDRSGIGGAPKSVAGGSGDGGRGMGAPAFNAPMLSADAQVVIYNSAGFFADNGIKSLQALAVTPKLDTHPWLWPVGQAYRVVLSDRQAERFIAFNYLQRDVPEGYEQTLKIYFLPEGGTTWEIAEENVGFVENLIVSRLKSTDGVYAVMATVALPELQPGWNLLAYPMPDRRCVRKATNEDPCIDIATPADRKTVGDAKPERCIDNVLAALGNQFDGLSIFEPEIGATGNFTTPLSAPGPVVEMLEPGHLYWIQITGDKPVTPFLAPPKRQPDGALPCSGAVP